VDCDRPLVIVRARVLIPDVPHETIQDATSGTAFSSVPAHLARFPLAEGRVGEVLYHTMKAQSRKGERVARSTLELPYDLWKAMKIISMDAGVSLRQVVIEALTEYVARRSAGRKNRKG
jgi:hypothetical protein